jgi:hypothetical protein
MQLLAVAVRWMAGPVSLNTPFSQPVICQTEHLSATVAPIAGTSLSNTDVVITAELRAVLQDLLFSEPHAQFLQLLVLCLLQDVETRLLLDHLSVPQALALHNHLQLLLYLLQIPLVLLQHRQHRESGLILGTIGQRQEPLLNNAHKPDPLIFLLLNGQVDSVALHQDLQLLVLKPLHQGHLQTHVLLRLFHTKTSLIFTMHRLAEIMVQEHRKLSLTTQLCSQAVAAPQHMHQAVMVVILQHMHQALILAILQRIHQVLILAILQHVHRAYTVAILEDTQRVPTVAISHRILQVAMSAVLQQIQEIKLQLQLHQAKPQLENQRQWTQTTTRHPLAPLLLHHHHLAIMCKATRCPLAVNLLPQSTGLRIY